MGENQRRAMGDDNAPYEGRVNDALLKHLVKMWKERIASSLWSYVLRVKTAPIDEWITQSSRWVPNEHEDESNEFVPYRSKGRPCLKWDDSINRFFKTYCQSSWQNVSLDIFRSCRQAFINDFCGYDIPIPVLRPHNRVTRTT